MPLYDYNANKRKKAHKRLIIIIAAICGFTAIGWFHQQNEIGANVKQINHQKRVTKKVYRSRDKYTLPRLEKHYDASEPNIDKVLGNNRKSLQKGFNLTLNKSVKLKNYNRNRPQINHLLGNSLSGLMANTIHPTGNNGANYQSVIPKGQTLAQSLNKCSIAYGQFDDYEDVVPVNIYLSFQSTKFSDNTWSDTVHKHKYSHHIEMEINGTLFVKQNSIQVNNHYIIIHTHDHHQI